MTDTVVTTGRRGESIWMRILTALILLVLFGLAEMVLWVMTVLQLIWLPLNGAPNKAIADFGSRMADWVGATVAYLTGSSETRPFPWSDADTTRTGRV